MAAATITSKGQLTLPKEIREALGVGPGDRLAFRIQADGVVTVEPETIALRTLRGSIKPRVKGITLVAMDAAIRQAATAK
jgi:antitoxin PrlF